jgi:hypothetical protein
MRRLKNFLVALTMLALAGNALACGPHFGPSDWTPRRSWRTCYANLKTLAGATEMYNLDYNTDVQVMDEAFQAKLVEQGYLQSRMVCPNRTARGAVGDGYVMAERNDDRDKGRWVACLDHGFVSSSGYESAYDQFARSEENAHLLPQALRTHPVQAEELWRRRKDWQERMWGVVLAMGGGPLTALLAFLG